MPAKPETALIAQILQYLHARGFVAVRINSGLLPIKGKDGKWRAVHLADKGTPDITALCWGYSVWIECKIAPNKPTPEQSKFLLDVHVNQGLPIVAYCLEDVIRALEEICPLRKSANAVT